MGYLCIPTANCPEGCWNRQLLGATRYRCSWRVSFTRSHASLAMPLHDSSCASSEADREVVERSRTGRPQLTSPCHRGRRVRVLVAGSRARSLGVEWHAATGRLCRRRDCRGPLCCRHFRARHHHQRCDLPTDHRTGSPPHRLNRESSGPTRGAPARPAGLRVASLRGQRPELAALRCEFCASAVAAW
jgi:hypothetical protein